MAYAWSRKNKQNGLVYNILQETLFGDPEEELGEFWQFRSPGKGWWPSRTLRLPFGKKQMWEEPGDGPPVHLLMLADARMEERWKKEFPDVWAWDETDCGRVAGEVEVSGMSVPFKPQPWLSGEMEEVAAWILWKLERGGVVFANLQDHIPDYWELARPLQRLTLQHVPWEWGAEQEQALSRLKRTIQAAPPLRFPDKSRPFIIRLTTNKETVAATLLQQDEEGRLVPVGHHSRMLKEREVSRPWPEKASLAAVWAVQAFKTLTGSAPICIQMPHSPWKCLLWGEGSGSGGTNLQLARWTLCLVNEGPTARGPQAERGLVPTAPPLQLPLLHVPTANVWFMATKQVSSVGFAAVNLEERWLLGVAEGHSALSAELLALREIMRRHRSPAPLYVYTDQWALVKSLRSHIRNWELWLSSGEGLWPSICQWVCAEAGRLHI
ncbi:hypothetical protein Q9233_017359, partial [Columba guinea]